MNILPHKSWHVRTKKNIARVRADEKKAAEEEKEQKRRIELANSEARVNLLRERSKRPRTETETSHAGGSTHDEHVNFFKEVEDGKYQSTAENADHVKEQKAEKEKYEKSIGYLTYLGQDTNESLRKKDWYETVPDRTDKRNEDGSIIEVNLKSKLLNDPLMLIHKYVGSSSSSLPKAEKVESPQKNKEIAKYESVLSESIKNYRMKKKKRKHSTSSTSSRDSSTKKHKKKKSKKHKKHKKHSSDSTSSSDEELNRLKQQKLELLRQERLQREKIEREKAENLLRKLRGETEPKQQPQVKTFKQKYNSQFNPDIARQNQD